MQISDAIQKAGSVAALARIFGDDGISVQAVYKWGDTVPPMRVYELMAKRPDWFAADAAAESSGAATLAGADATHMQAV
jgi:hypothetical protein